MNIWKLALCSCWLSVTEWKRQSDVLYQVSQQPPVLQIKWSEMGALSASFVWKFALSGFDWKIPINLSGTGMSNSAWEWGNKEILRNSQQILIWLNCGGWLLGGGNSARMTQKSLKLHCDPSVIQNLNSSEGPSLRKHGIHCRTGRPKS